MDSAQSDTAKLREKIESSNLPSDLLEKLSLQLGRLERGIASLGYKIEFDRELEYLDFVASLPFNRSTQDILDLKRAAQILEKNHFGLHIVKERILEYLSVLILGSRGNQKLHSSILSFVGLVGSGKTSLAYSIAESLGRPVIRIPFGGLGSVKELRGQSRVSLEAEPSRIMKSIKEAASNNPVILLDEIDRVTTESRADVMGVLVELLDPEQNWAFIDRYVDFPFDLSKALFITTANNTGNIATAVLDRLEIIEMPSYQDEEKIMIGKNYLLPRTLKETGLPDNIIVVDDQLWPQIVRPLGFDGGIRSLQRNIQSVVRKIARKIVEGNPGPYKIDNSNVGEYLN